MNKILLLLIGLICITSVNAVDYNKITYSNYNNTYINNSIEAVNGSLMSGLYSVDSITTLGTGYLNATRVNNEIFGSINMTFRSINLGIINIDLKKYNNFYNVYCILNNSDINCILLSDLKGIEFKGTLYEDTKSIGIDLDLNKLMSGIDMDFGFNTTKINLTLDNNIIQFYDVNGSYYEFEHSFCTNDENDNLICMEENNTIYYIIIPNATINATNNETENMCFYNDTKLIQEISDLQNDKAYLYNYTQLLMQDLTNSNNEIISNYKDLSFYKLISFLMCMLLIISIITIITLIKQRGNKKNGKK